MLRISVNRRRQNWRLRSDVMVVVGDRKSANTKHLTEICSESMSPQSIRSKGREELPP